MFDMMKMMGKVKEAQEEIKKAQAELHHITAFASTGGDLVTVKVNGHKQVVDMKIDPSLLNKEEEIMLKDLIIAATNKALEEVNEKAQAHMQQATRGLLPDIPGFDLGNMMR